MTHARMSHVHATLLVICCSICRKFLDFLRKMLFRFRQESGKIVIHVLVYNCTDATSEIKDRSVSRSEEGSL